MHKANQFPAAPFAPRTVINSLPGGIQIIYATAPQVSTVVELSIEQLKEALEKCLQLRQTVGLVDQDAVKAMLGRKDLHTV